MNLGTLPTQISGLARFPKWGHLKELHGAVMLCEKALLNGERTNMTLGPMQEADVYTDSYGDCAAFLANMDNKTDRVVQFRNMIYHLPAWPVLDTQYTYRLSVLKLKLRSGIMTVVYQKCLSITLAQRAKFSEGEIQTFMSVDADPHPWLREESRSLPLDMLIYKLAKAYICATPLKRAALKLSLDPAVLSRLKHFSAMNKLKKMALRVIAERLSEEEIAGFREMFQSMDTDNSGAITFEELKAGLKRYGSNLKDTEIRDLMNADGTIDYGEFVAMMRKGDGIGRRTMMRSSLNLSMRDAPGAL